MGIARRRGQTPAQTARPQANQPTDRKGVLRRAHTVKQADDHQERRRNHPSRGLSLGLPHYRTPGCGRRCLRGCRDRGRCPGPVVTLLYCSRQTGRSPPARDPAPTSPGRQAGRETPRAQPTTRSLDANASGRAAGCALPCEPLTSLMRVSLSAPAWLQPSFTSQLPPHLPSPQSLTRHAPPPSPRCLGRRELASVPLPGFSPTAGAVCGARRHYAAQAALTRSPVPPAPAGGLRAARAAGLQAGPLKSVRIPQTLRYSRTGPLWACCPSP